MRIMGVGRLDRLLSLVVLIVCFGTFFHLITSYLSESSGDPPVLISKDIISLENRHLPDQQHHPGSRINVIAPLQPQSATESPTTEPIPTDETNEESGLQGFKIVGEGLQVPKGKDDSFLFIKTHKCGTSTLVNMFYLFGLRRRLNFVTQPWSRQLDVDKPLLPPRPGGDYNFQIAHVRFKPERQHEILPKFRTFYTTIIRSPIKHFNSAFAYFGADKKYRQGTDGEFLSLDETISKWLDDNKAGLEPNNTSCSLGNIVNGISKDLGFNKYLQRDGTLQEKIDDFIADLAQEFDFVLLTDYFDESLVLLKEQMGWEVEDIFFMKRFSTADRSRKDSELSQKTADLILKYNIVDVQLYNFFHQMFKMKVLAFGEKLLQEKTAEFRRLRTEFESSCFIKPEDDLKNQSFNKAWILTEFGKQEKSCTMLHMRDILLDFFVSELQVKKDFTLPIPNGDEIMKQFTKKNEPMDEEQKELVMGLQRSFDDHGVRPVYV
ncbi:galactosylceramide sulfotransferase-like [Bolinopsis microptera]|uniref:galactosylceramide sulfotransferase-like n=1 Tax=Bolinopsis microptera TaxID=2820187 RepID=UPI003078D727